MDFDRKTLEKLSVTKDWAWGGLRFLEKNKSKIQLGIVGTGIVLLVLDMFCNPLFLEVFLGLLFATHLSVLRGEKFVRETSRQKLENELDFLSGENRVDEIRAEPSSPQDKILDFEIPAAFLPRSTPKKIKFINHLGAALRALTLAPSFPRYILTAA